MLRFCSFVTAAFAAFFLSQAQAAETAERQFEHLAALAAEARPTRAGQAIEVEVDLAASPGFSVEADAGTMQMRYRMAFNNIAEGWSWQPQADLASEDYYRYKFLPLQSVSVERGEYVQEDKIGVAQPTKISWRYDYFLAFANLYDFYPRTADDDAGFVASTRPLPAERVGMRAIARLAAPFVSESTTFWKAMYGKPTDFTLKKRYLVADLEEIRFYDRESGEVLAALKPATGKSQR